MAARLFALVFLAATLFAANPFEGRWAIQAADGHVFWLEVNDNLGGSFFGATGGRLAKLLEGRIENGAFTFAVERVFDNSRKVTATTTVRRDGDGIEGTTTIDARTRKWKGWRSPQIADREDGSWRKTKPVNLLDVATVRSDHWAVESGVLRNRIPKADLIVSREAFWNFEFTAEYKLPKGGNSGIGIRHHYELQLADDYGQPPDVHGNASLYSRIKPARNASKPPGEWQTIHLRLIGRELTVVLNGVKVIDREAIEGLCGLALDPHEERPGPVSLQGDHGPVEFRNVTITPLVQDSK